MFCFLDDFLEKLLWTGVKGKDWPKRTYLIASIKSNDGKDIFNKRCRNTPFEEHAEVKMLRDDDFLQAVADHDIEITLTLNYSPCSDCANELKIFFKNGKKIRNLIIQFSFLYRIQEEINKTGLCSLSNAGVTLKAMKKKSWLEVGIDLKSMTSKAKKKINKRDKNTGDSLNKVLSTHQNEQDQDTSDVDELSSQFQSQLRFRKA